MSRVSIVSTDGHAVMPLEAWSEYLEPEFHDHLPAFQREDAVNARAMYPMNDMLLEPALDVFDSDGVYRAEGWTGAWDSDVRIAQMDREGIAAELVYHGFFRVADLGFSVMNDTYPLAVVDAGVRAYDRWAFDTFGAERDRLLLVGAMGTCSDLDATMDELRWVADHGFVGTYAPGFTAFAGQPPLYDEFWDPVWALYAELGLTLVVHGGYGLPQGFAMGKIMTTCERVDAEGGSELDLVMALVTDIFNHEFVADLRHRHAMWQLMFGGVFDRHPDLRLLMTEVRGDWIPETLAHFDATYDALRDQVPSRRRPSEWWQSNCLVGLSFMHKAEMGIRDGIGIDRISFGRDYPHAEGTWPNTREFLGDLFAGVPEADVRKMLGENAIAFFGLDEARIAAIAERIGPRIEDVTGAESAVDPALIDHLGERCGYLKPLEGGSRLADLDALLRDDLVRLGGGSSSQA